ncbi:MAG: hypothetical protein ACK4S0_08175, partial [Sediminibacterium sp.]
GQKWRKRVRIGANLNPIFLSGDETCPKNAIKRAGKFHLVVFLPLNAQKITEMCIYFSVFLCIQWHFQFTSSYFSNSFKKHDIRHVLFSPIR